MRANLSIKGAASDDIRFIGSKVGNDLRAIFARFGPFGAGSVPIVRLQAEEDADDHNCHVNSNAKPVMSDCLIKNTADQQRLTPRSLWQRLRYREPSLQ